MAKYEAVSVSPQIEALALANCNHVLSPKARALVTQLQLLNKAGFAVANQTPVNETDLLIIQQNARETLANLKALGISPRIVVAEQH